MADCERALGRLDRALDIVTGPDARAADPRTRIELRIVESGIRRDQGLLDAAVVALQGPELAGGRIRPEYGRLYYAYADALLEAGREEEARDWFGRAASADVDDETDAAERYEELDDFSFDDLEDEVDEDENEPLVDGSDLVADQGLDDDNDDDEELDTDLVADQGLDDDNDDDEVLDTDLVADQGLDDDNDDDEARGWIPIWWLTRASTTTTMTMRTTRSWTTIWWLIRVSTTRMTTSALASAARSC